MAKNSPDQFIRGGQTTQHWIRMAAQVLRSAIAFAALVFSVVYAGLCLAYYEIALLHVTWAHWLASFFVENRGEAEHVIRYRHPMHGWVNEEAAVIYQNLDFLEVRASYQEMAVSFACGLWCLPSLRPFLPDLSSMCRDASLMGTRMFAGRTWFLRRS